MSVCLTVCAAVLLLPAAEAAASVGIAGGPLYDIAAGTDIDETVYVATGTGLYTSIRGRDIWTPANAGLTSADVYAVIAPVTGTALYCATGDGIFQSSIRGEAWVSAGLKGSQAYCLSVHPVTATWLVAGADEGVYTTTNAGATWETAAISPPFVYALAFNPAQPSTIHAASFMDGVHTSTDFGATWTKSGPGPEKAYCVAVRPDAPAVLYAGTTAGLYKSINGGLSWAHIAAAFSAAAVYRIAIDPLQPTIMYVATDIGIYKSIDGGGLWFAAFSGIATEAGQGPFVREIVMDPDNSLRLYAGTYSGAGTDVNMYRSVNGGYTWVQINRTLATTTVTSLAFDSDDADTIFAGTSTLGVLKSTNGGLSWREANSGLRDTRVRTVAVAPQSGVLYAGTTVGLFRSRDAGLAWEQASPPYDMYRIGIFPDGSDRLYVGTDVGIFSSADEGESWQGLNNNLVNPNVSSFAFDPDESGTVFVGTRGAGIFKTLSGGQIWFEAHAGIDNPLIAALASSPDSSDVLYAGTDGSGAYKSFDGGETWEPIGPEGNSSTSVSAIAVHPDDAEILYVATTGKGLYRSIDGGATWAGASPALAGTTVYDVVIDPHTPQRVLLALDGAVERLVFNAAPDVPALPSPADGAVSQPLTATLSWTCTDPDPGDRLSFAVYFGVDPDPENNVPAITPVSAFEPGILQLGQTYFWRVVATDASGATSRGAVWRFSTSPSNPPLVPANPLPGDGAAHQSCFLVLRWDGGDPDEGDAVSYDVYFGTHSPPRLVQRNLPDTEYAVNYLRPLTSYYWQIVARDSSGVETTGPLWIFSTGLLPPACLVEAVLGSDSPALADLRAVRDHLLVNSAAGRELIQLYYLLSPALSRIAGAHPEIQELSAELLAQALVYYATACSDSRPEARDRLMRQLHTLLESYAAAAEPTAQTLLRYGHTRLREFLERFPHEPCL